VKTQVTPGTRGRNPTTGSTREQAGPDEERLADLLHRVGLFTHSDRERRQADRTATE
jgi:hypothetical protein